MASIFSALWMVMKQFSTPQPKGPCSSFMAAPKEIAHPQSGHPLQLQDQVIAARVQKSKTWMAANLRQKDLLIVGFWSDWQYLNQIIGSALNNVNPLSVTVADPSDAGQLQQKAPHLWALAHATNVSFDHVQESGSDVLDELRRAFSKNYIRQVIAAGRQAFEQEFRRTLGPRLARCRRFRQ